MRIPSHLAAAALALAVALLPACEALKPVSRVTKVESISASRSDPLSKRFVGQSLDKWEDGEQHSMDRQRIDTTDLFGGSRSNQQFGGDAYRKKRFNGNKRFTGNKDYKPEGYQFVKDREMARKEAIAASQTFGERDKRANEGRKSWFGRDKAVTPERANAEGKSFETRVLPGTTGAQRAHNETELDIHRPQGRDGKGLSFDDLKEALGRGDVNRTTVMPVDQ